MYKARGLNLVKGLNIIAVENVAAFRRAKDFQKSAPSLFHELTRQIRGYRDDQDPLHLCPIHALLLFQRKQFQMPSSDLPLIS